MLIGKNNEEKIWNFLYEKIGNAYGTAGLIGNLQSESGLNPKNMENYYEILHISCFDLIKSQNHK